LLYSDLDTVVNKIKSSSNYVERQKEIEEFNRLNRFKKRGISLLPLRYSLTHNLGYYNALVTIRHHDGSCAISHGGIEMGQGLPFFCSINIDKIKLKYCFFYQKAFIQKLPRWPLLNLEYLSIK
jgi:xanthine dehydrogenase molybdopterin-binding subunit B